MNMEDIRLISGPLAEFTTSGCRYCHDDVICVPVGEAVTEFVSRAKRGEFDPADAAQDMDVVARGFRLAMNDAEYQHNRARFERMVDRQKAAVSMIGLLAFVLEAAIQNTVAGLGTEDTVDMAVKRWASTFGADEDDVKDVTHYLSDLFSVFDWTDFVSYADDKFPYGIGKCGMGWLMGEYPRDGWQDGLKDVLSGRTNTKAVEAAVSRRDNLLSRGIITEAMHDKLKECGTRQDSD